jgi:hypothetical protein
MSIATLKKKTQAKYNNLSVGLPRFSINGTLRNQGYVGQTSLSRFTSRTLYNGIYPRGHGGCCGTFKIGQTVQSGILPLNNPNVIKASVVSTKGMIEEELKCLNSLRIQNWKKKLPTRTVNTVKPDNNQRQTDQGDYITNKAKQAIQCAPDNIFKTGSKCGSSNSYSPNVPEKLCNFTKPPSFLAATSQGERLIQLNNQCATQNKKYPLPSKGNPVACGP